MSQLDESANLGLKQLQWRYAVKKFDPTRKLTTAQWNTLESALILSPSSYGLQPWKFIVVQDPAIKEELKKVSFNQSQVSDCSHYVVIAAKEKMDSDWIDRHLHRISDVRGVTMDSLERFGKNILGDLITGARSHEPFEWATRQCYLALGQLVASAAMISVDTCPMEGLLPDKYDEILKLKDHGFRTVVSCAVGFRAADDKFAANKKVRFPASEVIDHR